MTAEIYEFDIKNVLVVVPSEKRQERIAKQFIQNVEVKKV